MEISGRQTRTVFEQYNISNEDDLKEAARKQDVYWECQKVPLGGNGEGDGSNLVETGNSVRSGGGKAEVKVLEITDAWDRNRTGTVLSTEGF